MKSRGISKILYENLDISAIAKDLKRMYHTSNEVALLSATEAIYLADVI